MLYQEGDTVNRIKNKNKRVSVNISFDDIANEETTSFIYEILEQNREYTRFLEFEILESEEISDFNEVSKFITKDAESKIVVLSALSGTTNSLVEISNSLSAGNKSKAKERIDVLEKHYKVKPILYSYVDFYENNLGKKFNDYPLWIAHYFEKDKPRISRDWHFWQHSENGRVNGITTKVDFNVFKGDSTAFKQLLIAN